MYYRKTFPVALLSLFLLTGCNGVDGALDEATEKVDEATAWVDEMKSKASDLQQTASETTNPSILLIKNKKFGEGDNKVSYADIFDHILDEPVWSSSDEGVTVMGTPKSATIIDTFGLSDLSKEDLSFYVFSYTFEFDKFTKLTDKTLFRILSVGGDVVTPGYVDTYETIQSLHGIYFSEN